MIIINTASPPDPCLFYDSHLTSHLRPSGMSAHELEQERLRAKQQAILECEEERSRRLLSEATEHYEYEYEKDKLESSMSRGSDKQNNHISPPSPVPSVVKVTEQSPETDHSPSMTGCSSYDSNSSSSSSSNHDMFQNESMSTSEAAAVAVAAAVDSSKLIAIEQTTARYTKDVHDSDSVSHIYESEDLTKQEQQHQQCTGTRSRKKEKTPLHGLLQAQMQSVLGTLYYIILYYVILPSL